MTAQDRINLWIIRQYQAALTAFSLRQWKPHERTQTAAGCLLRARKETALWSGLLALGIVLVVWSGISLRAVFRQPGSFNAFNLTNGVYCGVGALISVYAALQFLRQRGLGATELLLSDWPVPLRKSLEVRYRRANERHVKPAAVHVEVECLVTYGRTQFGKSEQFTKRFHHQEQMATISREWPSIDARCTLMIDPIASDRGAGNWSIPEWSLITTLRSSDNSSFRTVFPIEVTA